MFPLFEQSSNGSSKQTNKKNEQENKQSISRTCTVDASKTKKRNKTATRSVDCPLFFLLRRIRLIVRLPVASDFSLFHYYCKEGRDFGVVHRNNVEKCHQ